MAEDGIKVAKALIIGLGSAGQSVCENIAKNLNSKYGYYKNAKWIGIRVLETAYKSNILNKDDFIDLSVDQSSFRDYTSGNESVGYEFALGEWIDTALIKNVGACINSGAANVRMAGRLALFHNYSKIHNNIVDELTRIDNLRSKDVQEALQTNQKIDFGKEADPIYVYVIASLCGGTGSGCCADMGYLIRQWNKKASPIAFFTLPHPDLGNQVLKKNAFTALIELNHYCLGNNAWTQRLPGSNEAHDEGYPYDIIYLTSPANPMINEKVKNEQAIASFLIALTSETSQDMAAANVDGTGSLQTTKEFGYLKPYFSTFGIASLEYPGEHITRMCKEKILQKLYSNWKDDSSTDVSKDREELFEKTPQKVVDNLREQSAIKSKYEKTMKTELENLGTPKNSAVHNKMGEIFSNIENEIRKDPALTKKADEWLKNFQTRLKDKFEIILDKYLVSLDAGPGYISRILKKGKEDIDAWVASKGDVDKAVSKAKDQVESGKQNIKTATENCLNTKENFLGGIFGGTKKKDIAWREVIDKSVSLVGKIVNLVVAEKLKEFVEPYGTNYSIQKIYSKFASEYITRLDHFELAINNLHSFHESEYKDNYSKVPVVNGKQFLLNDSIEDEINFIYKKIIDDWKKKEEPTMPSEVREKGITSEIIEEQKDKLIEEMKAENSCFEADTISDTKDYIPNSIKSKIAIKANQYFKDLSKYKHIIHEIRNDALGYIQIIRDNSKTTVNMRNAAISERFKNVGKSTITPYSYALCPQSPVPNLASEDQIKDIKKTLGIELGVTKEPFDNKDSYRITGIRTAHGASLAHIDGIFKRNDKDIHALEDSNDYDKFNYWNTRKDVNWTNCLISNELINDVRENWIVFTLLGKNKNWYDIRNNKFIVDIVSTSTYNDKVGTMEITSDFNDAVMEIVSNSNKQIRILTNCRNRIKGYIEKAEEGRKTFVEEIFKCLESIKDYYMNISKEDAKPYLVEYCFKNGCEQDYYNWEFPEPTPKDKNDINPVEKNLSHLHKFKDEEFINNNDKADRDGYFCPNGHPLDDHIEPGYEQKYGDRQQAIFRTMVKERFICRRCDPPNNRYWPYADKK